MALPEKPPARRKRRTSAARSPTGGSATSGIRLSGTTTLRRSRTPASSATARPDFVERHDDGVLSWACKASSAYGYRGINLTGAGTFLLTLALHKSQSAAEDFQSAWEDPPYGDDPIGVLSSFALRRYQQVGKRFTRDWSFNNLTKAHNMSLDGSPLRLWRPLVTSELIWPYGTEPK